MAAHAENRVERPAARSKALSLLLAFTSVVLPFAALLGKHPAMSALAVSGVPLALVAGLLGKNAR